VLAFCCCLCATIAGGWWCSAARAADGEPPLQLSGVMPGGLRLFATDSWATFDFNLTNRADRDRHARVVVFYQGRPDVQYGRDVWVPARSTLATRMLVGPPPEHKEISCEVEVLLYERDGGQEHLVLPREEERVRSRAVLYRKREPFTAVLIDEQTPGELPFGRMPEGPSPAEEALDLVRTFRAARNLSELVHAINARSLPATDQAFDGTDHLVLASAELAHNPAGMRALRRWLEGGGTLWVMLDLIDPEALAPLLGGGLDFQVVDRVPLTSFRVETEPAGAQGVPAPLQQHERPVNFARVLLPPHERVRHTVNGWPAWFTRRVGRGDVVFTALGPRGWSRPRARTEASPYPNYPSLPIATEPFQIVAGQLHSPTRDAALRAEPLRPLLEPEIGYTVIGRGPVVAVLGSFLLAAVVLGVLLRRSRRPELVGWLAPAAALGAAAVFLGLGEWSRRAAPATGALAQIVEAVPGTEEAAVHGLLALYRPESGPVEVGAEQGGFFELDMAGLEGQTRRLMLTDLDAWHWDKLSLPAGVRFASFHYTAPTGEPLSAVARFGADGLEGELKAGPFRDVADALLSPRNGRDLAVRLRPDGSFTAGGRDVLPPGQFLAGAVLSDRQQRRQDFYREALKRTPGVRPEGPPVLLAWADPIDTHFTLGRRSRVVGDALLVIPVRLERAEPGRRVTIPGPLLPYRRLIDGRSTPPTFEFSQGADMELRFQLPRAVLPLKVERARLLAKIAAAGRRVTVAGRADGAPVELYRAESPLDPVEVNIADGRLLRPDEEGGLHLNVSLSELLAGEGSQKWTIDYLELGVSGTAE
jgi:hypothetical protein